MLLIYVASRGVNLQRITYTQEAVDTQRMRRSIALVLMKTNDTPSEGLVAHHFTRVPATHRANGAAQTSRNGKRRRVESRVVIGTSNVRKSATLQSGSESEARLLNRKRTARLLADNRKRQRTMDQMLKIPQSKRARIEKLVGREVPDM